MSTELEQGYTIGYNDAKKKLRDHFAGLAMQAMLTRDDCNFKFDSEAAMAYDMADAMLKEREKKENELS